MEEFIDHLGHLAQQGHLRLATRLADDARATDPLRCYLGHAMIAATQRDVPKLAMYAKTAQAAAPDHPLVAQALALLAAIEGRPADAEAEARRAVKLDDSPRSWLGLANILFLVGKAIDAEQTLRELLAKRPDDAAARFQLGRVRASRGDQAGAVEELARAFALDPDDVRPQQQALGLYREAAWPLGVIMLTRVTRGGYHPPETYVLLDLMALRMLRQIEGTPLADVLQIADEVAKAIADESAPLTPKAQAYVARALAEVARDAEARAVLARVEQAAPLEPDVKAQALYTHAILAQRAGDRAAAIAAYAGAVEAWPKHWEAATNAVNLCLEARDATSLATAGAVLAAVPEATRRLHLPLTFNEAVWLKTQGRFDDARALIAFMRDAPGALEANIRALEADLATQSALN